MTAGNVKLNLWQLIPPDIKFDPNATPPQFTNNEDSVIEPGTHVRVKLIGTRAEVGGMWAIASIKEDYLGYDIEPHLPFRTHSPMCRSSTNNLFRCLQGS